MPQTRTRTLPTPCPRCAGALAVVEQALTVAEIAEPVGWAPVRRYCTNGCHLTALADFPDEHSS